MENRCYSSSLKHFVNPQLNYDPLQGDKTPATFFLTAVRAHYVSEDQDRAVLSRESDCNNR